ncbi:MAG: MoxR family ATPase [Candidatus Sericytochromatia bacterium]
MEEISKAKNLTDKLEQNIAKAIVGKPQAIKMTVVALISGGHVLLEDVPGVGKTLIAKSIAKSIDGSFKRVQFTSDLLPSDIIGVSVYNQKNSEFEYVEGPLFANIVLADEINRGTPRTQSSLLEAMEELQVSVDGVTRALPKPFFVIGTQNPIESHGTFPLPDSQVDRFLISLSVGYPDSNYESEMLSRHNKQQSLVDNVDTIINIKQLLEVQEMVNKVEATNEIFDYIVRINSATRNHNDIMLGASPRASVAMLTCSKAYALTEGRNYVSPDDVKSIAPFVLIHRIIPHRTLSRKQITEMVDKIISKIPVS